LHSAADRNAELPVYGRDPFLALRHFIEPPSFTNLISRPVDAFWRKPCRALFHQAVLFADREHAKLFQAMFGGELLAQTQSNTVL
jgi:hypothetical protein